MPPNVVANLQQHPGNKVLRDLLFRIILAPENHHHAAFLAIGVREALTMNLALTEGQRSTLQELHQLKLLAAGKPLTSEGGHVRLPLVELG